MRRGGLDPALRMESDGTVWLTARTPDGGAALRLVPTPDGVAAAAWGDGEAWMIEQVPALLGDDDDPRGFVPDHPVIAGQWRRYRNTWRVPRSGLVWQTALVAVLEQRVTGTEAHSAWRGLLHLAGQPAPGPTPAGMHVPPGPAEVARVPSWEWHRLGVDRQRRRAVRTLVDHPHVLERTSEMPPTEARQLLERLPGIGPWTAAEVSSRALGDADSVSVGDYHLAADITFALTGRIDGADEDLLDLLRPYAGHRYRAVRMIELTGMHKPRRGPRMRLPGPQ